MFEDEMKKLLQQYSGAAMTLAAIKAASSSLDPTAEQMRFLAANSITNLATKAQARSIAEHSRLAKAAAVINSGSSAEQLRNLDASSAVLRTIDILETNQVLAWANSVTVSKTWRDALSSLDSRHLQEQYCTRQFLSDYADFFRTQESGEIARLVSQARMTPTAEMLLKQEVDAFTVQRLAMDAMNTPWIDKVTPLRSMASFGEIQNIGQALRSIPAFDPKFEAALRLDLGDWRDLISWPESIFTDVVARSEFYVERGFNPALTDFPERAFHQSLDIAGLRRKPFAIECRYGPPIPPSSDQKEEAAFWRANSAHDWLFRFETKLRRFIDEKMTSTYGVDWARHHLPNGLYAEWQGRKLRKKTAKLPCRSLPMLTLLTMSE